MKTGKCRVFQRAVRACIGVYVYASEIGVAAWELLIVYNILHAHPLQGGEVAV
jgi:hypothetical protein